MTRTARRIASMWDLAGCELRKFAYKEDVYARDLAVLARDAFRELEDDPETFAHFDPGDEFGNIEKAASCLRHIAVWCFLHPDALVDIQN